MDEKLTTRLQEYMQLPIEEKNILEGAEMLLKLNKNRILYQNIVRRPDKFSSKLFYELNKYLILRLDKKTIADVLEMQKQLPEFEENTLSNIDKATDPATGLITLGQRTDHNLLPVEIQKLWVDNGIIARRLKSLHEKLKLMNDAQPCDRYEILKELHAKDVAYRKNWNDYDSYKVGDKIPGTNMVIIDTKRISSNRKYLSVNKAKLTSLKDKDDKKYNELLVKMQQRYDELISFEAGIDEEQKKELGELGLKI